jgi:hypothetical protein
MRSRRRLSCIGALGALVVAALSVVPPAEATAATAPAPVGDLSPAAAARLAQGPTQPVVVLFKDQLDSLPATPALAPVRRSALAAIQAPVVRELHQVRAAALHTYSLLDAVSGRVTRAEAARLAADPAVAAVVPDQTVRLDFGLPATAERASIAVERDAPASPRAGMGPAGTATSRACQPGPSGVELDPEALSAIHANGDLPGQSPNAATLGITGAGVTVAFIAEGFDVNQPNFTRPDGKSVFVDEKDFTGEGIGNATGGEASLDASSIAAQGTVRYTVPLSDGSSCTFRVLGAAPGASLVGLKAFANNYLATTTSLLEAIDYAVTTDHVNVLNESFGYNPLPDTMNDVIRMADAAAVRAGVVVDVSEGDAGATNTIGSPSTDPAVISAGASTTYRVYAQEAIAPGGVRFQGWEDDNLSSLSSAGFSEGLKGPNLIAPGDLNWVSCNPAPGQFGACISGGTSEAAPLTSATAALVIQAYRKTHGGATPSPALVKEIITSTATDLGLPADQQGAGLLNAYQAVLAAESVHTGAGSPQRTGATLLSTTSEIDATTTAGATVRRNVTITNNGSGTETVRFAARQLGQPHVLVATHLAPSAPSFQDRITFRVPPGTAYLAAHAATVSSDPNAVLDIDLVDPLGRLAIDGLPQGAELSSNVGVRYPDAGTWTAYVTYLSSQAPSVPVAFDATGQDWAAFGSVRPDEATLRPGASQTVTVAVPASRSAGDESAAFVATPSFGPALSIPVAVRALIPIRGGTGTFAAQVFGGNGRGGAPASTQFFELDVPRNAPELDVTTHYRNGPDNTYSLYLVSPQGEAIGHGSNQLMTGGTLVAPTTVTEGAAAAQVLDPAPGRWTIVVAFANPASGTAVSSLLTGTVGFAPVPLGAAGLPRSPAVRLRVGHAAWATVTVRNTSGAPEELFVDGRLDRMVSTVLPAITPATGITLPLGLDAQIPQWIVPTDTTGLLGQVDATAPVTFDMSPYLGNFGGELNGDPQVTAQSSGDSAIATWTDRVVTPGVWNLDPQLLGVFTTSGTPPETANLTLEATTRAFDPAVSSPYGDFWTATGSLHPILVGAGRTVRLQVRIDPRAPGVVHGTLYVDTLSTLDPFGNPIPAGDQIAAIPYAYRAVG